MTKPVRPEDVLSDEANTSEFDGRVVRKGTIKAFIENCAALKNEEPGTPAFDEIVGQLKDLLPDLEALGLFDVFEVKDPQIKSLLESA